MTELFENDVAVMGASLEDHVPEATHHVAAMYGLLQDRAPQVGDIPRGDGAVRERQVWEGGR
jgi:hypothetical protein